MNSPYKSDGLRPPYKGSGMDSPRVLHVGLVKRLDIIPILVLKDTRLTWSVPIFSGEARAYY